MNRLVAFPQQRADPRLGGRGERRDLTGDLGQLLADGRSRAGPRAGLVEPLHDDAVLGVGDLGRLIVVGQAPAKAGHEVDRVVSVERGGRDRSAENLRDLGAPLLLSAPVRAALPGSSRARFHLLLDQA